MIVGVVAGGFGFLHHYSTEIVPRAAEYRQTLTNLRAADVRGAFLSTGSTDGGRLVIADRRRLSEEEIASLVPLLGQAVRWVPNYPRGGWRCVLELETAKSPSGVFEFEVHGSENNGTLLRLHSRGRSGWNYGTLRDDALGRRLAELIPAGF